MKKLIAVLSMATALIAAAAASAPCGEGALHVPLAGRPDEHAHPAKGLAHSALRKSTTRPTRSGRSSHGQ